MKAVKHDSYGDFSLLALREVDRPQIAADQVLVRVHAAALHVGDCFGVRGAPLPMRFVSGLFGPKVGIPGFDLAGTVEAAGASVTRYKPGDTVFGVASGTCAEYAPAGENELALIPPGLSFEEAAAMPTSGLAALHALRDVAGVTAGQKVMINGAAGGVGHFAVQIAAHYGAEVTGVCSAGNAEMVRALGAAHVIDYTREDFALPGPRFDVIFDNVENRSLADTRRALKPGGTLILNSGTGARGLGMLVRLVKPLLLSPFVNQSLRRYLSVASHQDLVLLGELARAGRLSPVIDRVCDLHGVPQALRHIERGHSRGKVVVKIPP